MDKDIEELFRKKNDKENIYIDNSLFNSFDDCSFRSNTFQQNFNTTKGRINNRIKFTNQYNNNTTKANKRNIEIASSKRINAIKKCFNIVKNRNELNKVLMNKCQKILSDKQTEKDEKKNLNEDTENIDKDIFSNTCNSFFKKNVDNFINNYLKNNYCINENINTLNNVDKNDNCKAKNITVNKNSSLYNLTKNEHKNKEEKITVDKNKNIKKYKSKNNDKPKMKKISTKKYINVNRMEKLKTKNNNYFSKLKKLFNKKEQLIKNKSYCQKHKVNNSLNSKKNKLSYRNSINVNFKEFDYKYLNDSYISKNNISLRKRNSQNNHKDNYTNLKYNSEVYSNSFNYGQKLSFRHSHPNNAIEKSNKNNSERMSNEKYKKLEYNKSLNLNYTMTSPTIYSTHEGLHFNSPNFAPFRKISINSPYYENLSFSYKSLKEKINKIDNNEYKYKTLNIESNEEAKINKIYTNTYNSNNTINKKIHIVKKGSNSQERKNNCKLNFNDDKYKTININKVPIVNNSINYFSQMSKRDNSSPYIISHIDTNSNIVSEERKKRNEIKENFFDGIDLKMNYKKENSSNNKNKSNKIENLSNNTIYIEDKNRQKINENKNIRDSNNSKVESFIKNREKLERFKNSKKKKITIPQKKTNQDANKKIIDYKNKTSYHFFNINNPNNNINSNNNNNVNNIINNNNNYDSYKKIPKILREKHFSDINSSILDKNIINNKKINPTNKMLSNKLNKKIRTSNDNKNKLNKKSNNNNNHNKYSTNNTNNNNIYKKPFSISSARENNYDSINNKNNDKNEKVEKKLKKMKSFINTIEKIINICGSKNNNKENYAVKNKYLETYNNNAKNKNIKKFEKQKIKKNGVKEFEGIININISKIKLKPINNRESFIKKYGHYAIKKEVLNNCYIYKEQKITKFIYKKEFSSSKKKNGNNNSIKEKINGGICPVVISEFYNNNDIIKFQPKEEHVAKYNSFNYRDSNNKKSILNSKGNSHLKINKNSIKNQLNKNTTSILEYKDLNKKLKFTEQNDDNSNMNYYDEESEVTFGRKDQIILNNKTISNKKSKNLNNYDLSNEEKINIINNNTFCYNNNYEIDNEMNKDMILDEESFANGEVNFFANNTFKISSNQKPKDNNNRVVYDFEINSVTNNYYNNNNIILFSPQQKKLYFKYIEKGTIMISNIFLLHKKNIYKDIANYAFQKNKNKSESIIYMKKKLKDNGTKKFDITLPQKSSIFSENNNINYTNEDIFITNKEKMYFEKKKNNTIKKLKIRTKSSDYIIFDKNDNSIIKKVEIEISNKKKDEIDLNTSFNTPRGFDNEEKNIISPHFVENNDTKSKNEKLINNYISNNKESETKTNNANNIIEKYIDKNNLKNFHCTPKFCQLKPCYVDDTKLKRYFNENKKHFTLEEILYFGSCNSLCFKENLLSEQFNAHCEEMLKYVEIIEINKPYDMRINNNERQNNNKSEILYLLNKITYANFDTILDKLSSLMTNDNNYQYIFVKLLINKVVKEKKYILLYAKLCFNLYGEFLIKVNSNNNIYDELSNNLGFDNDLKNILISECKLKFNKYLNEIKCNEIQFNINDIKNKIFCFFDFIIELVYLKLILFDNIIHYLEKLYKESINNNNGNNISILYLELIIYLLDKTMKKIKNINNKKNKQNFKKFYEEKIMLIFENSELLQNYLKYKIFNVKEKLISFINNNNLNMSKKIDIDENKIDPGFDKREINDIIYNILLNNKKEENIKKLLINDLQNFIKLSNEKIINYNAIDDYNWFIIDELIFETHISLSDLIICYIEISKDNNGNNTQSIYEYFEIVLNYFLQYSLDYINYKKEKSSKRIMKLFTCFDFKQYHNKELFLKNLGYILFLLLDKYIISINDIDFFINEKFNKRHNIANMIKHALLFDKEKNGKLIEHFKQTKYFINNKELFSDIIKYTKNKNIK